VTLYVLLLAMVTPTQLWLLPSSGVSNFCTGILLLSFVFKVFLGRVFFAADGIMLYRAKRLAEKNVCKMTCFVLSGT